MCCANILLCESAQILPGTNISSNRKMQIDRSRRTQQETEKANDANPSIMYTFVDDFFDCARPHRMSINQQKKKHKLEIVSAAHRTELNVCKRKLIDGRKTRKKKHQPLATAGSKIKRNHMTYSCLCICVVRNHCLRLRKKIIRNLL